MTSQVWVGRVRLLWLVGLAAMPGCTSHGGGAVAGNGSISLSLTVTSASVGPGSSVQVGAALARSGDFTGAVTFTVEEVPVGVTGAASNVQTSGGTSTPRSPSTSMQPRRRAPIR